MTARGMAKMRETPKRSAEPALPLERSVGYQLRMTHRAVQRALQARIQPYGVTLGMWYFLRVLWDEDGLTQRDLSKRIGTMEPTTLNAIAAMERAGLVTRQRDQTDARKLRVLLTVRGRSLKAALLPEAIGVVDAATKGFSARDRDRFLDFLAAVQSNLADFRSGAAGDEANDYGRSV